MNKNSIKFFTSKSVFAISPCPVLDDWTIVMTGQVTNYRWSTAVGELSDRRPF